MESNKSNAEYMDPDGLTKDPELECDLVMKGGATSGLVYPPAVFQLARKYRLRNIGGTSAGAVAASLTAAAEFNRGNGGFSRLKTTSENLQQPSFLRNLFQGTRHTEPLLKILMRAPQYGSELENMALKAKGGSLSSLLLPLARWLSGIVADSGIGGVWRGRWGGLFAGFAAALALSTVIWTVATLFGVASNALFWYPLLALGLVFGVIGFILGGLLAGIGKLYETATSRMPDNLFGICSGLRDPCNGYSQVAATEWLHDSIEKIAGSPGRTGLLTFKQLEAHKHPIKLQFVTTDISASRPYVLPFDDLFIFKKEHFEKLFPPDVVSHLVSNSRRIPGIRLPDRGEYYFLPNRDDWPVVVGARLSMSFPFLFSSVPLFRLPLPLRQAIQKTSESNAGYVLPNPDEQITRLRNEGFNTAVQNGDLLLNAEDLVPHWFSDGGIASNFPIHFFDHWLPARPTFGITLRYLQAKPPEEGASRQQTAARRSYMHSLDRARAVAAAANGYDGDVWLPTAEDCVPSEWQAIHDPVVGPAEPGSTLKFAWGVIKTMQNYRDNMQAALASYRERIVQVRLQPDEGGLNLDMPAENMKRIVIKGNRAGNLLRDYFALRHHQWARLRVLVSRLEEAFGTIKPKTTASTVASLITDQAVPGNNFPYNNNDSAWCDLMRNRVEALLDLIDGQWRDRADKFASASTLRVTPEP